MPAVAVVLAGGKGTRSADPTRAKLAQEVGGRSLMEWHLALLEPSEIREVVVVAGHLGDQVQALCDGIDHHGLTVRVIHEERQEGTVAALRLAAASANTDEFLVVLGDILMSFPVQHLLDDWRASGAEVAVAVHPSTHPEDSDAAFPTHDGSVLVVPKQEPRDHVPNMSSAGLFAITRVGLERYSDCRDLGSDVLPAAAEDGDLFAFISSHYFKDTGTPSRLDAAQQDLAAGAFARRGLLGDRPALFLDRDGVLNPIEPEFHEPSRYTLLPGVSEAVRDANRAGIPVVVVTNQPAIAKGLMTFEDHQRVRARMDQLLAEGGAFVDDYLFCPHHPEAGWVGEVSHLKVPCECRKPNIDLARQAAARHLLDLGSSVMVGDTERDRGFARGAGMRFIHVSTPHEGCQAGDCFPESAAAIRRGIEVLGVLIAQGPLRISLFGGGSDLPAFLAENEGAVLSFAIDQRVYIVGHPFTHREGILLKYSQSEDVTRASDLRHPIARVVLDRYGITDIDIAVMSDVPAGTGMGSSSSFTVAFLAFVRHLAGVPTSPVDLAREACEIEIDELREPIGYQDQWASALGGINVISFAGRDVRVESVALGAVGIAALEENLHLVPVGKPRSASELLAKQGSSISAGSSAEETTRRMVDLVQQGRRALLTNVDDIGPLLHEAWALKREVAAGVSNPAVDDAYARGMAAGATGGKLLGAGGSGYLAFYVPADQNERFTAEFPRELGFRISSRGAGVIHES